MKKKMEISLLMVLKEPKPNCSTNGSLWDNINAHVPQVLYPRRPLKQLSQSPLVWVGTSWKQTHALCRCHKEFTAAFEEFFYKMEPQKHI